MRGLRWGFLVAAAAALAGCASTEQQIERAMYAPEWELCYVAITGRGPVGVAHHVIGVRRIDCRQHMAMVQAKIAANQQQQQQALRLLQAAQPRPAPANPTTYCRSVMNGNVVNTVCD